MKPEPISVTQLNKYIKDRVAEDEFLNNVYVKGEISNFKHHYTGHMYFTLKDGTSLIKCIMFKTSTATFGLLFFLYAMSTIAPAILSAILSGWLGFTFSIILFPPLILFLLPHLQLSLLLFLLLRLPNDQLLHLHI